jgi:hypothetical protein
MSVKNVFKSRMPSMNYVFASGKYAHFIEGVYMTDIQSEILELNNEIKIGNPFLYIDENQETFDSTLQDEINKAMADAKLAVLKKSEAGKAEIISAQNSADLKELAQASSSATLISTPAGSGVGIVTVNKAV